jgi:hypothetical protein
VERQKRVCVTVTVVALLVLLLRLSRRGCGAPETCVRYSDSCGTAGASR